MPFDGTGISFKGGKRVHQPSPVLTQFIEIGTMHGPGPKPVTFSPPQYEDPKAGVRKFVLAFSGGG